MADADFFLNPAAWRARPVVFSDHEYARVQRFFRARPHLTPTPLRGLPSLAASLGVADVVVKDESARFGLQAFKIVGVTYAVHTLIEDGRLPSDAILACATAGNHGRAVAHAARANRLKAVVYVPAGAAVARQQAIRAEGAEVVETGGTYDDAVRRMAADALTHGWAVVSDTSWDGYEEIPRRIMAGYTWILEEARGQWAPDPPPDVVIVQGGVGGLVCAAASWFADMFGGSRPFFIACEPDNAACLLASARAGHPVAVTGQLETVMAGLRCAEVSPAAWPAIRGGVDAFVSIPDTLTERAMRMLGRPGGDDPPIEAGASGACGLGALLAILEDQRLDDVREKSGLGARSRVLLINTEGAIDPAHYARIVGERA